MRVSAVFLVALSATIIFSGMLITTGDETDKFDALFWMLATGATGAITIIAGIAAVVKKFWVLRP